MFLRSIKLLALVSCLAASQAWALDPVTLFNKSVADGKLGPVAQQSFCYQLPGQALRGVQAATPLRIASVTKLFTTLVSLDAFTPDQRWQTTFTLANNRLHIAGGLDPWFEGEKVLALIAELQAHGVTKLDAVTFDDKFNFEDFAREYHGNPTPEGALFSLKAYFKPTVNFSAGVLAVRAKAVATFEKAGIYVPLAERGIPTLSVSFNNENPLAAIPGAQVFVHSSRPLQAILKNMNAFSNNRTARNLWNYVKIFKDPKEILSTRAVPLSEIRLLNGSGLGTLIAKNERRDNLASCRAVLAALDGLERVANERKIRQEDVVATGLEIGHFDERFVGATDVKAALLVKTGTLYHTSALSGWIMGSQPYKFAILNQTQDTTLARKRQDQFLTTWVRSGDQGAPGTWPDKRASLASLEGPFFEIP
jgi:D-alanyl-D-alanine carboxypeptidase